MRSWPAKCLAFVYWRLRDFFGVYEDGYSDWKALAIICCAEIACVVLVLLSVSVALNRLIIFQSDAAALGFSVVLSCGVVAWNYYVLRHNNGWVQYRAEFEAYPARIRIVGSIAIAMAILGITVATLIAAKAASNIPR